MSESLRFDREEVLFKSKGNANRLFSKLILKNTSENYIGYKVKGNNVKRYIISKPLGKIKPFSTLEINIEMTLNDRDLEKKESISDKFCCFYMFIEKEDTEKTESELEKILKLNQSNRAIHRLKIRSRVAPSEDTKEETPFIKKNIPSGSFEPHEKEEPTQEKTRETVYFDQIQVGDLRDSMDVDMGQVLNVDPVESEVRSHVRSEGDFQVEEEKKGANPLFSSAINVLPKESDFQMKPKVFAKKMATMKKEIKQVE